MAYKRKSGRFDGYKSGIMGSPEVLTYGINYDMNGAKPLVLLTNITTNYNLPYPQHSLFDPASLNSYGCPNNPMYSINNNIWANSLIHWVLRGSINPPHQDEQWVIPLCMNYYRTWLRIKAINFSSPKTFINLKIKSTFTTSSPSWYELHYLQYVRSGNKASLIAVPYYPIALSF